MIATNYLFMSELEVKRVKDLLDSKNIEYTISEHEPVFTSEQAAKVRGVDLKTGVKALVLKTKEGNFILGLVAADKKIDLKKLAEIANTKDLELAKPEEVLKLTNCKVGSVHPFGILHNLPTYLDISVLENEYVNFNIGLHTKSIQMKSKDLVEIVKPVEGEFSV
jgi:Ala-tRNA(Pro) deacylase